MRESEMARTAFARIEAAAIPIQRAVEVNIDGA
jgi:hypothetical protein